MSWEVDGLKILELRDVCFSYDGSPFVEGLNLGIGEGRFCGLIGPNGSGKSTIMKITLGILTPDSGDVLLWGKDIHSYSGSDRAKLISYLPQLLDLKLPFTVRELVSMGAYPYKIPPEITVAEAVDMVGLHREIDSPISELSGGERRRAFIAMTLLQGAGLILLDEPLANLDIRFQIELIRLLKELREKKGISVLMALHDINLIYHFDYLFVVKEGLLVCEGAPLEIITEGLLSDVYGVELKVYPQEDGTMLFRV